MEGSRRKEVAVLYISALNDGYGDLLFGLKLAATLRDMLSDALFFSIDTACPLHVVTNRVQKFRIQQLGGDKEFNLKILSTEEYQSLYRSKKFKISFFATGPVTEDLHATCKQLEIPAKTPILLLRAYAEFGIAVENEEFTEINETKIAASLRNETYPDIKVLATGLQCLPSPGQNMVGSEISLPRGIFICDELRRQKQHEPIQNAEFEGYWQNELAPYAKVILNDNLPAEYSAKRKLFVEYSSRNQCAHFIRVAQIYSADSQYGHDVISIGKNIQTKLEELSSVLPELIDNGFNKVVFINLDNGDSQILHDDSQANPREFRFYHISKVSHRQMIALMAVSEDLIGVTGDQSFGEALSAGKFIVYEHHAHQFKLALDFVNLCEYSVSPNASFLERFQPDENKDVKELVELLSLLTKYSNLDFTNPQAGLLEVGFSYTVAQGKVFVAQKLNDGYQPEHYAHLKKLLHDPIVVKKYRAICETIALHFNLSYAIHEYLRLHPDYCFSTNYLEIRKFFWDKNNCERIFNKKKEGFLIKTDRDNKEIPINLKKVEIQQPNKKTNQNRL